MEILLYHANLYPDQYLHYPDCALLIEDSRVLEIIEDYKDCVDKYDSIDLEGQVVLPGFIDVHTHGGYGYDFLKNPDKAVKEFSKGCVKTGTTSFLASFVAEEKDCLLNSLGYYQNLESTGFAQCLSIHLEGPFLNTKFQAVMREGTLRNPDLDEFKELVLASNNHISDITIACELDKAYEVIDYAVSNGIEVMLGHSDATVDDAREAIKHGARGLTHLYNAMSSHTHRNPGLVTAGLLLDDLICELICDGFHVDKDVIRATYKAISADRIALVTDSSLVMGLDDGIYEFSGQTVNKKGIKATVVTTGRIAGSAVGMIDCVKNMMDFTGCSFNEAVLMASINPSKIASVDKRKGKLLKGYDADLVVLDKNYVVKSTYVKGVKVYG